MTDIELFNKNQYLILNSFIDKSVLKDCRTFLQDALLHKVLPVYERYGVDFECFSEGSKRQPDFRIEDVLNGEDKHLMLGQFPLEIRLSSFILPLAKRIGRNRLLQEILGTTELSMHYPPMMRFVPPGYNYAAVPAHQDISYNRHLNKFITVWLPLVNIDLLCGGIAVYQDSQNVKEDLNEPSSNGWLPAVNNASTFNKKVISNLTLGDAVLLSPFIVHESVSNSSKKIRLSMDLRIFPRKDASKKHSLNLSNLEVEQPC